MRRIGLKNKIVQCLNKTFDSLGPLGRRLFALKIIFLLAISSNMAATAIDQQAGLKFIFWLAVFLVFSLILSTIRGLGRVFEVRKSLASTQCPKQSLVCFISKQWGGRYNSGTVEPPINNQGQFTAGRLPVVLNRACPEDILGDAELLANSNCRWNWEMILRAIYPHIKELKTLHLIGSNGKEGSFCELQVCRDWLQGYFASTEVALQCYSEPVDFNEFAEIEKTIEVILHKEKKTGTHHRNICIDVTGGMKPTSIAAAMTTYRSELSIQYVHTNSKEAIIYDIVLASSPETDEGEKA